MNNFERGKDPLVAMGIGKFARFEENLKEYFKEIIRSENDIRIKTPIYKSIRDSSQGNQHKFLIYFSWSDPKSKKALKNCTWRLDIITPEFSHVATNFYKRDKFFRKYGFPVTPSGLIMEIIYFERRIKRKNAKYEF